MMKQLFIRFHQYVIAVLSAVIVFQISWLVDPYLSLSAPYLPFMAAVMVTAWYGELGPAFLATILYVLLVDYFFSAPSSKLMGRTPDLAALGFFALEAMGMAYCIDRLHRAHRSMQDTERQLRRLQQLSARLVEKTTLDAMLTLEGSKFTSWTRDRLVPCAVRCGERSTKGLLPSLNPTVEWRRSWGVNVSDG
jgi:K+-sensing histidine kinase KdpD